MGLDAVEIVIAVEEAFDIQIEDSEVERIFTPGELTDLVISKVATTNTDICLTHRSFNLLRWFLVHRCGFPRKQVRLQTSLPTVFPPGERQSRLQQLSAELAIPPLPALVRPNWLTTLLWGLALFAGLAAAVTLTHSNLPVWLPSLLVITVTGYLGAVVTRTWRTEFPNELRSVEELARWIMTHKSDLAVPETTRWTRAQVAARVQEIVIKTLGCESAYREDARFIQDLGLD